MPLLVLIGCVVGLKLAMTPLLLGRWPGPVATSSRRPSLACYWQRTHHDRTTAACRGRACPLPIALNSRPGGQMFVTSWPPSPSSSRPAAQDEGLRLRTKAGMAAAKRGCSRRLRETVSTTAIRHGSSTTKTCVVSAARPSVTDAGIVRKSRGSGDAEYRSRRLTMTSASCLVGFRRNPCQEATLLNNTSIHCVQNKDSRIAFAGLVHCSDLVVGG